jgi:hypothetical protein
VERSGIAAHVKDPANSGIITQLAKLMSVFTPARRGFNQVTAAAGCPTGDRADAGIFGA